MLITVGAYTTLVATLRTSARLFSPRSACGRYSVLPEGLLGALPGHGQGTGRRLQVHSNQISEDRSTSSGPPIERTVEESIDTLRSMWTTND